MLRSLKLKAFGPKVFPLIWEWGCEVYKSVLPHAGIPNEGGCIAANGEEASMVGTYGEIMVGAAGLLLMVGADN